MKPNPILRFLPGRFIAALGDQFLLFSAPLIVYQATGSIAKSGLAFFIEWTPRILSLPIAGFFADRMDHKTLYFVADLSRALICFISFLALKYQWASPFLVVSLMMALLAIFNSLAFITIEATVPKLFGPKDLPKAQSFLQGLDQLSQVAGPALAALLLSIADRSHLVGLASLGFMFSAINVFTLGPLLPQKTTLESPLTWKEFMGKLHFGFNIFISKRDLILLSVLACVVNLVMGTTLAQVAPLISGTFGRTDQFFGGMTTMAAILSILTFTQIPKISKYLSLKSLGGYSLGLLVLAGLLLSQAPNVGIFVVGYGILTSGCAVFNIFMRTWRAQIIPKEHLGKVIGILVLINNCTLPLSGILVAAATPQISSQGLILTATIILFLVASAATFKLKASPL